MGIISATELARNTRTILDRVIAQQQPIVIERNDVPVAQIVPAEQPMTAAQWLAGLKPTLTAVQAAAWLKDSAGDFEQSIRDPWA